MFHTLYDYFICKAVSADSGIVAPNTISKYHVAMKNYDYILLHKELRTERQTVPVTCITGITSL